MIGKENLGFAKTVKFLDLARVYLNSQPSVLASCLFLTSRTTVNDNVHFYPVGAAAVYQFRPSH